VQREFPQVDFLVYEPSLGYCGAYNLLIQNNSARYFLVLDDDTVIQKGTLQRMVEFMDLHPEVGIAGCMTRNPDGSFQKSYGLRSSLKSELLNALGISSFWPNRLYENLSDWREVEWLNGSFLFVRREVIESVGALDEYYYTYSCEQDWCWRISQSGWRVAYVTDAEIIHVGNAHSINTAVKRYSQIMREHINRYYFFHKHYSALACFLLRPIMSLGAILRCIKYLGIYATRPARRTEAGPRIRAFISVAGLAFLPRPYVLPGYLRKQNDVARLALSESRSR